VTKPNDLEAILYAFAVESNHDRSTLERYLKQYPELAEELIDLSSELRLGEALGPSPASKTADTGWEAAWQDFLACKPREAFSQRTVDLFALFRGEAFVRLADALNVPRSFLTAFRDGLVTVSSIPERFVQRFAQATNASVESVRECFARARPTALGARAFKSEEKPSHQGQKTFREFVQSTEMTEEQRQLLLQDCNDDGLD
jgi:hypothetical protein